MAVEGTLTDADGNAVEGALVVAIDESDDSIIGTTTTAADGSYSISTPDDTTAHVLFQHDDGSQQYNAFSYPWVDVAPSKTVIADFNDQDFSPWQGDTSPYGWNTSDPIEGTASLQQATDGASTSIYSTPGDGLPNYFPKGNVASVFWRTDTVGGSGLNIRQRFGLQDTENCYQIQYNLDESDNAFLFEVNGGSFNGMDSDSNVTNDYQENTIYETRITWDDGSLGGSDNDITVELYEQGSDTALMTLTANNSLHASNEGIGINVNNQDAAVVDIDDWYIH